MTNLYSLLWIQCTESLQQDLRGHGDFDYKYISFESNWLLNKIKVATQGIKEESHSNTYDSAYKLVSHFFNYRRAEDESCENNLKRFLDIRSSLNLSGIYVTTHGHLTGM